MENNKQLYDKLMKMNIKVLNNYALYKLKLRRIYTCYETEIKLLKVSMTKTKKHFIY